MTQLLSYNRSAKVTGIPERRMKNLAYVPKNVICQMGSLASSEYDSEGGRVDCY